MLCVEKERRAVRVLVDYGMVLQQTRVGTPLRAPWVSWRAVAMRQASTSVPGHKYTHAHALGSLIRWPAPHLHPPPLSQNGWLRR